MTGTSERLTAALRDRYAIERELGQGGMATADLARDLRHQRRVALKVLRPELAAIIGAERFLQEIRTTANLQHPHILALHDSGTVDGTVYYVMPLVEGESLRDRLPREKQLPVAEAVRLCQEVAAALDYAHRHGVIHRDVKPENILLHDGQALVADFGIALAASGDVAAPVVLFRGNYGPLAGWVEDNYDVTPDGNRFLIVKSTERRGALPVVVVLNWFEELRARMAQ